GEVGEGVGEGQPEGDRRGEDGGMRDGLDRGDEPMSTTNMTGFFTCARGWNFLRASSTAWRRMPRSSRLRLRLTPRGPGGARGGVRCAGRRGRPLCPGRTGRTGAVALRLTRSR